MNEQSTNASTDPDPSVLIVEDNEACRDLVAEHFRLAKGFGNILQAECGSVAVKLLEKHSPDVIVCDCYMPWSADSSEIKTYGFTVVDLVRRKEGLEPVVIMISGFGIITTGIAYDCGVDSAIPKTVVEFGESVVAAARHHLKVRRELGTHENCRANAGTSSKN